MKSKHLGRVRVKGDRRAAETAPEAIDPERRPSALPAAHELVYNNRLERPAPRPIDRGSTVQELADEFVRRHARPPYLRPSSIRNAHSLLRRVILPALGAMKVEAVSQRHIEDLRDEWSGTKYQANRALALLSRMFTLCEQWDLEVDPKRAPLRNPCRHVVRFEETKCERWLKRGEIKRLLVALRRHPDQESADCCRLITLTGCRKSEALTATWSEFDLEEALWSKPSHHVKQRRPHHVPLSSEACLLLRRMKRTAQGTYLFPGRPGVRDTRGDLYRFWDEVRRQAKIDDVRIHDLRHTFASHLVSAGESLELVGELLGHTNPQTTARYSHLASAPLREVSNRFGKVYREASGRAGGVRRLKRAPRGAGSFR